MKIDSNGNTEQENSNDLIAEENAAEESAAVTEEVPAEEAGVISGGADDASETENGGEAAAEETPAAEEVSVREEKPVSAPAVKTAAASSEANSSGALPKLLALLVVFLLIGAGLVYWKGNVLSHAAGQHISKEEMEMILADMNPMMLRQLSQSPEAKKQLADNVAELFAIASQAEKDGVANDTNIKRELENIEYEILAVSYDREINKDKGPMPPFGFISEEQVNQFWNGEGGIRTFMDKIGLGMNNAKAREAAFERFLDSKIALAKEGGSIPADRQPSEEEIKQAKDYYAKTRIYYAEAMSKKGQPDNGLPANFFEKVELQTRLQKAQFLARRYATNQLAEKVKVTEEDIDKYIAEHPEINTEEEKKNKALELLQRAKSGEDFAALAKEFSEDPGSKEKGGLYENIAEGSFVPEFENAAFSLQPGEIYAELVPTRFGFHIIKLEKLGETKDLSGRVKRTFDARHILISTMYKDPNDPMAREMPVRDYVRQKLQEEKEKWVLEEIKANNPVTVATDFEIPTPEMPEQPQLPEGLMNPPDAEDNDKSSDKKETRPDAKKPAEQKKK